MLCNIKPVPFTNPITTCLPKFQGGSGPPRPPPPPSGSAHGPCKEIGHFKVLLLIHAFYIEKRKEILIRNLPVPFTLWPRALIYGMYYCLVDPYVKTLNYNYSVIMSPMLWISIWPRTLVYGIYLHC